MNLAVVRNKLTTVGGRRVQQTVGKVVKHSPVILTTVGIAGGIGATFLIARATLHLESLLDHHERGLRLIELNENNGKYQTKRDKQKEVNYLYAHTVLDLMKLYGPGVSLGVASIVSVAAGQGISQRRQVALAAAVKSAESAFQAYRQRVIDAIGEDKEAEIRYGISTETIEQDGKKVKVKQFNPEGLSDYVFYFDETNKNWQRGAKELNFLWLKQIQNWANDRLEARGYVYLNEVLEWLGIVPVPMGQVVGWLHKDFANGDGYIDFQVDNPVNTQAKKIGDMSEGILLDFNVDGEIMSKL